MRVQNGGDIEGPEAMEEAACLTTCWPPALATQHSPSYLLRMEEQ